MRFTPHDLAAAFVEMNDEQQADFFIACARIMRGWGTFARNTQALYIGGHLKNCGCSNDETREFVGLIADEARGLP